MILTQETILNVIKKNYFITMSKILDGSEIHPYKQFINRLLSHKTYKNDLERKKEYETILKNLNNLI